MARPWRIAALLALVCACAAALAAGCSARKTLVPRTPPETSLFVQGPIDTLTGQPAPVDTVNHVVHLYWFGSDPDGFVVRYEYRFVFEGEDADTVHWNGILDTDHVFTIPTPSGYAMPKFEVRSVDNDSLRDDTPAAQDFQFGNLPPAVAITDSPPVPDTTFASVTVRWSATDPDGDGAQVRIRAWLDGRQAQAHELPPGTTTFTFPTADFETAPGMVVPGSRSLFLQAIDDGGRASTPVSATWYVRSAEGAKLLLIDDLPSTVTNAATFDAFYLTTIDGRFPGQYRVLDLERSNPFRSALDLEQTLKLFPSVMWYRENNPSFSTLLHDYQSAVEAYLRDGPNSLYLNGLGLFEGENVCGPTSATNCGYMTVGFAQEFCGTDYFIKSPIDGRVDSTVFWTCANSRVLSPVYADSLRSRSYNGLRGFGVRSAAYAAVVAPPGSLSQPHPYDVPIGVRVPQPTGGRLIVFSFPLRGFDGFGSHTRVLQKVLDDLILGITP